MLLLLKSCDLHDLAQKTSVKLALTVDDADLFQGRTHVSAGVNIVDKRGVHQLYDVVLKDFYEWGEQIQHHGIPESEHGPKFQPFTINNDSKATWYLSLKGGSCKNKTHFCHLCACMKKI
jgi:hypothetical protein